MTSLTKSASSTLLLEGFDFTLCRLRRQRRSLRLCATLSPGVCSHRSDSARLLHRCGVTHHTSLRSQLDHDDSFSLPVTSGEADCLFSTYSHGSRRTMLSSWPLRLGFPALPSTTAELFVLDLFAQHDPQPHSQLACGGYQRDPEALLRQLAAIEAF